MRTLCLAIILAGIAGCADPADPQPQGPNPHQVRSPVEAVFRVGDQVVVDSVLEIAFAGVPSDSRCPTSVQCFWEGDAAIVISTTFGDGPTRDDTLHTTLQPRAIAVGGYHIALLDLLPYPEVPEPIPLDAYRARIEIVRLAR